MLTPKHRGKVKPRAPRPSPGQPPRALLDWGAAREIYETTPITLRALAHQFGQKSDGPLRRKIAKQGWKRNIAAITARLTTQAIATGAMEDLGEGERNALESVLSDNSEMPSGTYATTKEVSADSSASKSAGSSGASPRRPSRPDEDIDLRTAKGMADLHAAAIREQVRLGRKMAEVAELILDDLETAFAADPAEATAARMRLMAFNPKVDTLAGILKAAAGLGDRGVVVNRKALSMDAGKGLGPGAPPPEGALGAASVRELLHAIPTDVLMTMRKAALELSRVRLPAPQIVGEVAPEGEKPARASERYGVLS
jgi:hypothetical protein